MESPTEWDWDALAAEDAEVERQLAEWDARQHAELDTTARGYDALQALQRRRDRRVELVQQNSLGRWTFRFGHKPAA